MIIPAKSKIIPNNLKLVRVSIFKSIFSLLISRLFISSQDTSNLIYNNFIVFKIKLFYSKIKIDDTFFYFLMNSNDVFPLFMNAYDFVKENIDKNIVENFYQSNKRTEEECGLKFYHGAKKIFVGSLYIWRMRSSRVYYIGWWIDSDHTDLFFKNKKEKLSWKKK